MSYTCVECGGRLVLDCKTGYYVCSNCGLVHELAVYDRTFYEEEPRPMRQDYKVRAMERRINRLMLRLFGAPRTREVEWFLSKLKELHPELSSLIDEIEASSVRRAARIAYQRLGIPYGDIKEAIRRAHLKVDVRLKELGPPRPRRRVKLEGKIGEETRRMRRIIGKIFLAGIPESKDAVAYILACRRLGLKIEPERAARIYGVSVKLVKKRLREIRRILRRPAHVLVFRYRLSVKEAAYLKGIPAGKVYAACDKYRGYFAKRELLVGPLLTAERELSSKTLSRVLVRP